MQCQHLYQKSQIAAPQHLLYLYLRKQEVRVWGLGLGVKGRTPAHPSAALEVC